DVVAGEDPAGARDLIDRPAQVEVEAGPVLLEADHLVLRPEAGGEETAHGPRGAQRVDLPAHDARQRDQGGDRHRRGGEGDRRTYDGRFETMSEKKAKIPPSQTRA